MKSCSILLLSLSLTLEVFDVSGKYLLVEVDAERGTKGGKFRSGYLCQGSLLYVRIFTIKLYSKKFHNILECIQDSDCTGNSDTCVKGQCRCGTKPRVCRHSLNPAVKIMCIEGECVKIPGNKNNTKLFD